MPIRTLIVDFGESFIKYGILNAAGNPTFYVVPNTFNHTSAKAAPTLPHAQPPITVLPQLIGDALVTNALSVSSSTSLINFGRLDPELKRIFTLISQGKAQPQPLELHIIFLASPFVRRLEKWAILEFLFSINFVPLSASALGLVPIASTPSESAAPLQSPSSSATLRVAVAKCHLGTPQETALFATGEVTATVVDIGASFTTLIPVVSGISLVAHAVKCRALSDTIILQAASEQYACRPGVRPEEVTEALINRLWFGGATLNGAGGGPHASSTQSDDALPELLYSSVDGAQIASRRKDSLTAAELCERLLLDAGLPRLLRDMRPYPFAGKPIAVSLTERTSVAPPVFLMGGSSAFPQLRATFTALVTRSVMAAAGVPSQHNGDQTTISASFNFGSSIPFEFCTPRTSAAGQSQVAQGKQQASAFKIPSNEACSPADASQTRPQVRISYPPTSVGASSSAYHSILTAPCIGASIAAQLPSYDESAILRKDFCKR